MKKLIILGLLLIGLVSLFAVESEPSEVVGFVKYECVPGLNFVALPMDAEYTTAGAFADANCPGMLSSLSYWDSSIQGWISADDFGYWEGDFSVENGSVLMVNALDYFDLYCVGKIPAVHPNYTINQNLNTLMIPLNRSDIILAGDNMANEIGTLSAVSYWDASVQGWISADDFGYWEGDFEVHIGMPLMVNSFAETSWPTAPAVRTLNYQKLNKKAISTK
jgi:hypothetical protein